MKVLKTIIIDDDSESIKLLKQFESENSVLFSIIAVLPDCDNIVPLLNETKPDVIFVTKEGFKYESISFSGLNIRKPKLLFASKDKSKAYDAFKSNAVDFVLKPLSTNSLIISIYKTIKYLEMETVFQDDLLGKIEDINLKQQKSEFISIKSVDKIELLKLDDIVFCEADGKYTEFITSDNSKKLSSRNLGKYVSSLNNNFFRIHHSYIVNIKYLVNIKKDKGLFCELINGHILPVSKRRQEEFMKFINY